MPELELTPATEPAPTQTSLLRRLFRPKDIGFYLMILLAWTGAVYTTYDAQGSRWYWQWLIPIFGLICIVTEWPHVAPTPKARALLVARQILHWGVVLLMLQLIFIASNQGFMDTLNDRQASFLLMLTVTLSTFLAGIYFDWRLCVVAIFLGASAIFMVIVQNIAPALVLIGIVVIIAYFAWAWWYNRSQERKAAQVSP
jgi:MFS family permease